MNELIVKYNRLNKTARKEVNDWLDFLLSKQKPQPVNGMSTYKNNISSVTLYELLMGAVTA